MARVDACPECEAPLAPRQQVCSCGWQRATAGGRARPGLRVDACRQCADPSAIWRFIHWLSIDQDDLRAHLEAERPGRSPDRTARIDSVMQACADARRKYAGQLWPDGAAMSVAHAWEQANPAPDWRDALIAETMQRIPHQQSREQAAEYVARCVAGFRRRPTPAASPARASRAQAAVESAEEHIAKLMADGFDSITATRMALTHAITRAIT